MSPEKSLRNIELFVSYAGIDYDKWTIVLGRIVNHPKFNLGKIVSVEEGVGDLSILVLFDEFQDQGVKRFDASTFHKYFIFPVSEDFKIFERSICKLIERERKDLIVQSQGKNQGKEISQKDLKCQGKHFNALKIKYTLGASPETLPSSCLYKILLKREREEVLDNSEINWLKRKALYFEFLGDYYIWAANHLKNPWLLTKAGKFYRKAGCPEKVIKLIPHNYPKDPKLNAAILTNRGGALRDLGDLINAEICGIEAARLNPTSYFPYNLLSALCFQTGRPMEGYDYLKKATELGYQDSGHNDIIMKSIILSDERNRKKIAKFLLSKDPERYYWVRQYLYL